MVRMIITWSLHNRLIVLLGTLVADRRGPVLCLPPQRRSLSRPDAAAGGSHHAEPGRQPRGNGAVDRIPIEIALNGMPGSCISAAPRWPG